MANSNVSDKLSANIFPVLLIPSGPVETIKLDVKTILNKFTPLDSTYTSYFFILQKCH